MTKDKRGMIRGDEFQNYIFYVSDFSGLSNQGRSGKMNADREIIRHLEKNLGNCKVAKYTEYHGERLSADSVGIVFPSHNWGISLAVYTFLQNLNIEDGAYVYAVTMGASMSGDVDYTVCDRTKNLEEFTRIFKKKGMGTDSDIYIRCIDFKREMETTEEKLRDNLNIRLRIENIMEGLLFHSLEAVGNHRLCSAKDAERAYWKTVAQQVEQPVVSVRQKEKAHPLGRELVYPRMENVFLDDAVLAGVRLCRVI